VHVGGLVADNYLHFGVADLLVPFASSWRPSAVALGVVSLWLLLAIELTSLLMRKLPRRLWRRIHMSSYVLFWTATLHGLLAGTDAQQPLFALATITVMTVVLALTLVRTLATPERAHRSPAARARLAETARAPAAPQRTDLRPPAPVTAGRGRNASPARGPSTLAVPPSMSRATPRVSATSSEVAPRRAASSSQVKMIWPPAAIS
jgi:hypothetical protein